MQFELRLEQIERVRYLWYFIQMEKIFDEILASIESAKRILVISHVNPDGDTLGSMCALKIFIDNCRSARQPLSATGLAPAYAADMLIQTRPGQEIPEIYEFLPTIKEAKTLRNVENIYDLVITVDVASIERMVLSARDIFASVKTTINIDHHKTNPGFGKINLINPGASSCGEILYDFFVAKNIEITKDMADCLYVALMTDTGGFRYDNTTPKALAMASALIERGADCADLARKVYDSKSKAMVMFQAYCVSNTVFLLDGKVAYTVIKNADMEKFGAKHEHTEGICETIRSIKTVEIACVIKENELLSGKGATTKVSLRTKTIDAIRITEKFQGGGHPRSAGCTINKPIEAATELLIEQIKKVVGC